MAAVPRLDRGALGVGAVLGPGDREPDRVERERRELASRRDAIHGRPHGRRLYAISLVAVAHRFGRTRPLEQHALERVRVEATEQLLEWLDGLSSSRDRRFEELVERFLETWQRDHELRIVPGGPRGDWQLEAWVADGPAAIHPTHPEVSDEHAAARPGSGRQRRRRKRPRYQGPGDGSQWDAPLGDPPGGT